MEILCTFVKFAFLATITSSSKVTLQTFTEQETTRRHSSSISKAVIDLLNPVFNEFLFIEDGNTVAILSASKHSTDLLNFILQGANAQNWLKFYLIDETRFDLEPKIDRKTQKLKKSSLNIFVVDGFESFLKIYEHLDDESFENDAYYLVILRYENQDWFTIVRQIFEKSWKRYMINTSLILMSNDSESVKIFTYFPYTESHCEKVEPVLIQEVIGRKWQNDVTIFPKKLRNFHGCPIKVALFNVPLFIMLEEFKRNVSIIKNIKGIEANLLNALASKYNFTLQPVVVDQWGFVRKRNMTTNGATEAILSNRVNMTLGIFTITSERNAEMKPSFPYHTSSFIFVIPWEQKEISRLIKPLSETVRMAVFSTFFLGAGIVFASSMFKQRWRQLILGHDNRTPFFNMVLSGLGGSLLKTPFNNFARFCLISWILLCFLINVAYQAKYFQFLTQEDDIDLADTFEKIAERKYTIYIRPAVNEFFDDHPELKIRTKILPLEEYGRMERLMQDPSTTAVLMHTFDFVLYKNKMMYRDKPLLMASQHILDQQIAIYYPNNSCLRHAFNPYIRDLVTNGMVSTWVKEYIDPMFMVHKLKAERDEGGQVITNEHLYDVYCVVIAGWITATLVFVMELISMRFQVIRKILNRLQ